MSDPHPEAANRNRSVVRHGLGFVASGGLAFLVDATVLSALHRGLGVDPFLARLLAIALAMIAGWLAHRRWTFAVAAPPTLAELGRYVALAWTVAALNYAVYALVLLARPATDPLLALIVSSLAAMTASYLGMRLGVFRNRP